MNRIDIAHQVSLTLGDHAGDYNIDGIVDDLIAAHDGELNSIDDFDSQSYWAIVETRDVTSSKASTDTVDEEAGEAIVAWLAADAGVVLNADDKAEMIVLHHKANGDAPELMAPIALPVSLDADHDAMQDAAESVLQAAGWDTTGKWEAVDTGYTVKVRRA